MGRECGAYRNPNIKLSTSGDLCIASNVSLETCYDLSKNVGSVMNYRYKDVGKNDLYYQQYISKVSLTFSPVNICVYSTKSAYNTWKQNCDKRNGEVHASYLGLDCWIRMTAAQEQECADMDGVKIETTSVGGKLKYFTCSVTKKLPYNGKDLGGGRCGILANAHIDQSTGNCVCDDGFVFSEDCDDNTYYCCK